MTELILCETRRNEREHLQENKEEQWRRNTGDGDQTNKTQQEVASANMRRVQNKTGSRVKQNR
ncbi:hypothetical protein JOB18_040292 [Solea senegalensis]|uniref:Uncharacterized protein n=1 Tax=Solea senegalensis TaxID=28829 RepID=A0AAV6QW69_SOLSE|nr:hypothetical protein JOB18_040292 [Solea senegalensis]